MLDLQCTNMTDVNKTDFQHIFTIVTNSFKLAAKLEIAQGLVISIKNLVFDFNIKGIENSAIGPVSTDFVTFVIKYLQAPLVAVIRLFLNAVSIPLGLIINDLLGFKWFNFKDSLMTYYPEYFILCTSPQFDI